MGKVRWGIIGCGAVTELKSGPGFQKAAGSELVAVMRRDAVKAADYARRHEVPRWYVDADALIADPEVNAVYVATPPGPHEYYAMKVLAAGKPCYMEKPMARNGSEARRMVEAFARAGVPLFVAYYRRALPRFLKVKELLDKGALGRIREVEYIYQKNQMEEYAAAQAWRLQPEHSGGGLILDVGCHALDLVDFYFGRMTDVRGSASTRGNGYRVEDSVEAHFQAGGVPGRARWTFWGQGEEKECFLIKGEKGSVQISCFQNDPIHVNDERGRRREEIDVPNPLHVAQPMIQTIVDALRGRGICLSTGVSALRTQEVIDRVLEAYYGGREDGFWKRAWPRYADAMRGAER